MDSNLSDLFLSRDDLVGTWITLNDPSIAELSAELGFDFVTVDLEHTHNTIETVVHMSRAVNAASRETGLIVRVPTNDPIWIRRVLDVGVDGVLIPFVNTAQEAELAVSATKYPPEGIRGVGPIRAARYSTARDEYLATANDQMLTLVQIETQEGLENIERISAVDGVDGVFIGRTDLSASLFGVAEEPTESELRTAIDRVIEVARKEGKAVGTVVTDKEDISMWMDRGMTYLNVGIDYKHLADRNKSYKDEFDRVT